MPSFVEVWCLPPPSRPAEGAWGVGVGGKREQGGREVDGLVIAKLMDLSSCSFCSLRTHYFKITPKLSNRCLHFKGNEKQS
jgi:hypothetical protein